MSVKLIRKLNSIDSTTKEINITYSTNKATDLFSSPVTIPDTSEQVTASWSFTVESSDFPSFDIGVTNVVFTPVLSVWFCIRNPSETSVILSYRVLINSVSAYTGNSTISASGGNNYSSFTIEDSQFVDIQVGDVIEVRLWADSASVLEEISRAICVFLGDFYFLPSVETPSKNVICEFVDYGYFGSVPDGYSSSLDAIRIYPFQPSTSIYLGSYDFDYSYEIDCLLPNPFRGFFSGASLISTSTGVGASTAPRLSIFKVPSKIRWNSL